MCIKRGYISTYISPFYNIKRKIERKIMNKIKYIILDIIVSKSWTIINQLLNIMISSIFICLLINYYVVIDNEKTMIKYVCMFFFPAIIMYIITVLWGYLIYYTFAYICNVIIMSIIFFIILMCMPSLKACIIYISFFKLFLLIRKKILYKLR